MGLFNRDLASQVVRLAVPVVISQLSQTVVGLVDTMMVGRIGVNALAATGLGCLAIWMVMGALGHLSTGTQILASRRTGQTDHAGAGRALRAALQIALPLGLLLTILFWFAYPAYFALILGGRQDPLFPLCSEYSQLRLLGLLPFLLIAALKGFFNGLGDTSQHMRVSLLINVVNVFFNWVFIFGNLGATPMGVAGAGLASSLATTAGAVYFLFRAHRAGLEDSHGFRPRDLLKPLGRVAERPSRLIRLSLPAGVQAFLVLGGFTLFMAMMKVAGTAEVAATNVIFTILSFSFMPGFGIGMAASTLIGQKLGAGLPDEAQSAGQEAMKIGMLLMGLMGVIFITFPDQLLGLFTDDAAVLAAGRWPLRLLGSIQVLDALSMTTAGCLEGAGLTLFVMWSEVLVNWLVFLPLSAWILLIHGGGINMAFTSLVIYLACYALILQWKWRRGDWKESVL